MLILGDLIGHISDGCEVEVCNKSGETLLVLTSKALEKADLYMSDEILNSEMEIWCADYINDPVKKLHGDCNIKIVQIEHATGDDYIVEFVREER